jgi:hypothetical protein
VVLEPEANGGTGHRMISVNRIDKSRPDETVTHDGKGEAVIRVARRCRRRFVGIVFEDRHDGTITKMRASKEK